jgi:hypothetical protein
VKYVKFEIRLTARLSDVPRAILIVSQAKPFDPASRNSRDEMADYHYRKQSGLMFSESLSKLLR